MKFRNVAALLALSAVLSACVSGTDSTPADSKPTEGFQAQFNPNFGILPFPNDLYSGTNGQLAIPGDAKVSANGPLLEMNHLDGYGTQSDISVYFTSPIDKNSIDKNDVIVLNVASNPTNKSVDPATLPTELVQGTDYTAEVSPGTDVNGSVLTIKPLKPLAPSKIVAGAPVFSTYMVIITKGLKDTSGNPATPSAQFSTVVAADSDPKTGAPYLSTTQITMATSDPLYPVAKFTLPQLIMIADVVKLPLDDVAVTFSFSTQFLGIALGEIAATAAPTTQPAGVGIVDTHLNVCDALAAGGQLPDNKPATCNTVPGSTATEVFAGTVALPYYLTVPAKGSTAALTDSWHNAAGTDVALSTTDPTSLFPKATVAQNVIPILVALPIAGGPCTMPGTGWPVVVFQHGITRSREDMLAIASGFGGSCIAVVAIDLPLHGVTNTTDALYLKGFERTFDMDSTGVAGATGSNIAGSGSFFINLNSTITSRDNLREGAADLINLVATLPNLHPVTLPATVYGFDSTQVFFVGHSLGGIIGTTFLGADTESGSPKIKTATLAMPGGHIAELLRNSPQFEPIIDNGLQQQGVVKGTQSYYDFYSQAQAVVEDGDPANYAALAAAGHPIHMIEVVGNGGKNLPDQVVPNSATQVLIDAMGLTKVTATAVNPAGLHGVVQFTAGDHGSILDPTSSAAATTEMQTETVVFITGVPAVPLPGLGETILISDNSVVKH